MRMVRLLDENGWEWGAVGVWLASAAGRNPVDSAAWGRGTGGRGVTGAGAGATVEGMSKDKEMR